MNYDKAIIRQCMLFQFHQSKNASQATKTICSVYGEDALVEPTCRYWFTRFTSGDFDLSEKERAGRPLEADDDALVQLLRKIQGNRHRSLLFSSQ